MSDNIPPKRCTVCGQEFPYTSEFFYEFRDNGKLRLRSKCKSCWREMMRQRNKTSEMRKRERERGQKRREANPTMARDNSRAYRERNYDQSLIHSKKYRNSHNAEIREFKRRWIAANPEKIAAQNHRRRAKINDAEGNHSASDLKQLYDDQCGLCGYCGLRLYEYDVDHYLPLSRGGSNYPENLILACASCNRSKGDKTFEEWAAIRGW